jgi:hypothetical protein
MSSTSFIRLGYAIAHVGASWRSMNKKLEGKLGNWNRPSAVDRDVIRPKRERIQDEDLPDYEARDDAHVATMRSAIKRDGLMLALHRPAARRCPDDAVRPGRLRRRDGMAARTLPQATRAASQCVHTPPSSLPFGNASALANAPPSCIARSPSVSR